MAGQKMDETPIAKGEVGNLNADILVTGDRNTRPVPVRKLRDMNERIPFGTAHSKMSADVPPGKKGFWINDTGMELDRAVEGGWNFVKRKDIPKVGTGPEDNNASLGDMVSVIADKKTGMRAYLMLMPMKMWQADQKLKRKPIDRVEEAILSGTLENRIEHGKSYVPKGGISVKTSEGGRKPRNYKP